MAFWSAMAVRATDVSFCVCAESDSVVAPKEASVASTVCVSGITTLPKSTAVPAGEERMSFAAGQPEASNGRTETKPVLFLVGSPLTVVRRAEASALKKVCETVLEGPTGGMDCERAKVVSWLLEMGVRPDAEMR